MARPIALTLRHELIGSVNVDRLTTVLLIGVVIWAYLGIIFELLTETVGGSAGKGRSSTRSWIGAIAVPVGLEAFRRGKRYTKRHGKLRRSG